MAAPSEHPATLVMLVQYDGTDLHGFARQPGVPTVQGAIETALRTLFRRDVESVGAGRTDTGVHAVGQVVSVPVDPQELPDDLSTLVRSMNALVRPHVRVRKAALAPAGFSARFDAVARTYRYLIATGPVPPLFAARYATHIPHELDLQAMREGAAHLVGEHDFRSFCVAASAEGQRTQRFVESIEISSLETAFGEELVQIIVRGNAFLHSMIRIMVGTLIEVGQGRRDPDWVARALEARSRDAAGPTAPPHGLTFMQVDYPADPFS